MNYAYEMRFKCTLSLRYALTQNMCSKNGFKLYRWMFDETCLISPSSPLLARACTERG